jgi:serine protease Do
MRHIKKSSLIIVAVFVAIVGLIGQNIIGNYYYSQSSSLTQAASSVVYIENGVTGVVSITDPFVNKTTDINVIYAPLDSGSGFIVNGQGYIVTAFHVVGDPETLKNQMILKVMNTTDVQNYIEKAAVTGYISNYNPQIGSELLNNPGNTTIIQTQPDVNTTTELLIQRNLLIVKNSKQLIKVKLAGTSSANSINADLVDVGDTNTDVALIKINKLFQKLPALNISSNRPGIGEKIQIYGYPVINEGMYSDFNQSVIKPSSTTGFLTSITPNNGTVYYQTNAITTHGYSGGPALDSNNNVLGIVIYSVESNNSQSVATSSLFLSSDYIIQICNKNNISINVV